MNGYHWFVLIVAALGWLFDCLDQQLFTLARVPAMKDLLHLAPDAPEVKAAGGYVTSVFIIGWATGGLIFGSLGDRIGRAKTMILTIVMYSLCTGLSALSVSIYDFAAYRFITGLGVGGEFAVGVALVAEAMPDAARPRALALLQALSAIGNISAALISMGLGSLEGAGLLGGGHMTAWRIMFLIGAVPALLAVTVMRRLKEPEKWQQQGGDVAKQRGSYRALFAHPTWRRHAIIGLLLASSGVIGLWGIGFFSADLSRAVFRSHFTPEVYQEAIAAAGSDAGKVADLKMLEELTVRNPKVQPKLTEAQASLQAEMKQQIDGRLTTMAGWTLFMQQIGAFLGMYAFGFFAQRMGRKPTFAVALLGAMFSTAGVFWFLSKPSDVYWMVPIMGFFQLSLFAGYAIYFAELFPTHLRSTGTSFCYNVGRYLAAMGPSVLGVLTSSVFTGPGYPEPMPWRYAGVCMCAIFLLGLFVLPFAPETRGKPLPE